MELTAALEMLLEGRQTAQLERDAKTISENYRLKTGTGGRLLTRESEAAAYAAARMPATFAAAYEAIAKALLASGLAPRTLLDCGAGTGAATWAAVFWMRLTRAATLSRTAQKKSYSRAWIRSRAVRRLFSSSLSSGVM